MKRWKKYGKRGADLLLAALAILVIALYMNLFIIAKTNAEGAEGPCWVLCMPESHVILRAKPGKRAAEFGGAECGARMMTDGKAAKGYLHVTDLAAEEESGWISARYIVFDEPAEVNAVMRIRAQGRVACRKWVDGKVKGWAYDGDTVTVYWMSGSWAVTSRGYIRSEFLEAAE